MTRRSGGVAFAVWLVAVGCGTTVAVPEYDAATRSEADTGADREPLDASLPSDAGATVVAETSMQRDAGASSPPAPHDAGVPVSSEHAQEHEEDAGPAEPEVADCPPPTGATDTGQAPEALTLEVVREPPLGVPFALAVSEASGKPVNATVQVCVNGAPRTTLQLYRGRGSVSLSLSEPGPLTLQARAAEAHGAKRVVVRARALRHVDGAPSAAAQTHSWTAEQDVVVDGTISLSASETLEIGPGTRVLLGANASLELAGTLRVLGTADDPVIFTRSSEQPWGGIRLAPGAQASIAFAWFVAGGGDARYAFGHSDSQPVLFVDEASLDMRGGGLIDNHGKAFGSRLARLTLERMLISRCDTGGQFDSSQLTFRHLHVLEIPDNDGSRTDDDNDGFYFYDPPATEDAGAFAVVEDSVFVRGMDDGIDQNGAKLSVHRVWIEGFAHEGVACSSTRDVLVADSVVRGCGQGIEAGYGAPRVRVERTLVTGNGVGIRFGDEYSEPTTGSLQVDYSIVSGNAENFRNFVTTLNGPLPDAVHASCSVFDHAEFVNVAGNVPPPAPQPWPTEVCYGEALLDPQSCSSLQVGPPCF